MQRCVSAGRGAPGALRLWSGCGTGAMEAKAGIPDIATAVERSESAETPLYFGVKNEKKKNGELRFFSVSVL